MTRRAAQIIGRAKAPSGMVHHLSDRIRMGRLLTLCGAYVENGWGSARRGRDPVACRNCLRIEAELAAVA